MFCRVPCHSDLPGRDPADAAAEQAGLQGNLISASPLGINVRTFLRLCLSRCFIVVGRRMDQFRG